jgi:hypothetical protein
MRVYFFIIIYLNLNKKTNMDKFSKVKELLASVEADAEKFYSAGNSAAGTRLRKAMQDLKVLAQDIRTEVTEKKNVAK